MRRLLILLLLLFASSAWATTTVTGHIADLSGTASTSGTFARFYLRGCGGNQPRVNGTALIAPTNGGVWYKDFSADSSGNISGTLYSTRDAAGTGNGEIQCGTSYTSVWYGLQIFVAGKGGPEVAIHAKNGIALDVTTVVPITTTPVATAPTGDTTYARLDGANMPFSGNVTAPNVTATTLVKGSQLQSTIVTGTAPLVIASSTVVPNLNASQLGGKTSPSGNIVGDTDTQTLTNKTLTSPVVNGTPTGTGISTLTLKNGSGSGNYTGSNTTYANVDTTNLCQIVTIPTGWKLAIAVSGAAAQNASNVGVSFSVADIGTTCGGAGTTPLKEIFFEPPVASTIETPFSILYVLTGDGAAHAISVQAKTSNATDAWVLENLSATENPSMVLTLMPSN